MNVTHSVLMIAVIAAVTALLRFLPFAVFRSNRKTPKIVEYLGKCLPFAIMGMLVVYCLRNTSVLTYPYGIPELIACGVTVLLHVLKGNTLLSIICGTASYIILLNFVF